MRRYFRQIQNVEKLNILTMPTHEAYETNLSRTTHNFFSLSIPNFKQWNKSYRPIPHNYCVTNTFPGWVNFDLILSQNFYSQRQLLDASKKLKIPIVHLEHCLPTHNDNRKHLCELSSHVDCIVFISEYSRSVWTKDLKFRCPTSVVCHGIDTQMFAPSTKKRDNVLLSVVNDWINRDWCCGYKIWQRATKDLPVRVVGDTPGLSKPAKNEDDLIKEYNSSTVFLNTSTVSPVPMSLMEAMSCGCCPIALSNCMIPEVVQNVHGFLCSDEEELRTSAKWALNHPDLVKVMGDKARQHIIDNFSLEKFVENWNKVFRGIYESISYR